VYAARNNSGNARQLTGIQRNILNLFKEKGPLQAHEICSQLNISTAEFENNFATLRHMELARGFRDGDTIRYTLF
jgi:DNA-binding IclR family transcriptional regulator